MSPSKKPFIVVFAGASHEASCMRLLIQALAAIGYDAEAFTLSSVGHDCAGKTMRDDEVGIRRDIESVLQQQPEGRDVLVMVHSFAGFPCSGALVGLDRASRSAAGENTAVLGVIYLAGFIGLKGGSLYDIAGKPWPVWMVADDKNQVFRTKDEYETFYNDVDRDLAATIVNLPSSAAAFYSIVERSNILEEVWRGRRGYIRCLKDNAVPLKAQDSMLAACGVEWSTRDMNSSHSPFLSMPQDLALVIDGLCTEFCGLDKLDL